MAAIKTIACNCCVTKSQSFFFQGRPNCMTCDNCRHGRPTWFFTKTLEDSGIRSSTFLRKRRAFSVPYSRALNCIVKEKFWTFQWTDCRFLSENGRSLWIRLFETVILMNVLFSCISCCDGVQTWPRFSVLFLCYFFSRSHFLDVYFHRLYVVYQEHLEELVVTHEKISFIPITFVRLDFLHRACW